MKGEASQLKDIMEARVVRVTEKTFAETVKTVNTSHSMSFIRVAFRRATSKIMTTKLEDDAVCKALQSTIIRITTSGLMIQAAYNRAVKK